MVDEKIIFNKDKISNKFIKGNTINNYKIIKYMGIVSSKHSYHHYWKCKCNCGNIVNVREEHLLRGNIMYCNKCKRLKYARKVSNLYNYFI